MKATGSLSRAFHFWLPRRTALDISRSPVDFHLLAGMLRAGFSPVT
jgi:hypothetical protein